MFGFGFYPNVATILMILIGGLAIILLHNHLILLALVLIATYLFLTFWVNSKTSTFSPLTLFLSIIFAIIILGVFPNMTELPFIIIMIAFWCLLDNIIFPKLRRAHESTLDAEKIMSEPDSKK